MQANIIPENIVFNNCYSGTEFENKTVDFLRLAGLTANRVILLSLLKAAY